MPLVDVYDGNNVMRRAFEQRGQLPGSVPMTLRMRYEHACAQPIGSQIWVWDGRDHNDRRRAVYPPYKGNRTPAAEDVFAQINLWRDVARHAPVVQVEVYGWEADDVIATLVRRMPGRCRVHSNDMDYGQIGHLCVLNGVNAKGVPPGRIALHKAMCGDPSDNIAGVPGFGPKAWEATRSCWDELEVAIVRGGAGGFSALPLRPAVRAWLSVPENVDLLQRMLLVTHFHRVPDDELSGGITEGVLNRAAAVSLLERFFL